MKFVQGLWPSNKHSILSGKILSPPHTPPLRYKASFVPIRWRLTKMINRNLLFNLNTLWIICACTPERANKQIKYVKISDIMKNDQFML